MGATGVVGGNLPLALGTALAHRLRGGDQVSVVFFGDGAVQAGHFNETINLASLWRLPLIFVCENNGMAEFTTRAEHSTIELVSNVVAPYDFARETVNGSDVPAVYDAFGSFLEAARGGQGPFLLECLTYRRRGHYEGDQQKYRDAAAEEEWLQRDPIARFTESFFEEDAAADIEREAAAEIEAAVAFARESPFPQPDITADLVYAK
jgi:pyruvate dehydrogenase E1 component alpha subunit